MRAIDRRWTIRLLRGVFEALPRLVTGRGATALAGNAGVLVLLGLLGASLVHVGAYHLGTSSTAAYLFAHCPWLPLIVAVLLVTLFNGLLFRSEWQRMRATYHGMADRLNVRPHGLAAPRRPIRLAGFFLVLYLIEQAVSSTALQRLPMRAPLPMANHQLMLMPVNSLFPLWLGHGIIGALLALLLWSVERRVVILRRQLSWLQRLASILYPVPCTACRVADQPHQLLRKAIGFAVFSRPPPRVTVLGR